MKKYYERVSLDKFGEILKITNVENKDQGIYVCALSYQFQCIYSMFTLTVESMYMKYHYSRTMSLFFHSIFKGIPTFCFQLI